MSGPEVFRSARDTTVKPPEPMPITVDVAGETVLTIHPDGRITLDQPDKVQEGAQVFADWVSRLLSGRLWTLGASGRLGLDVPDLSEYKLIGTQMADVMICHYGGGCNGAYIGEPDDGNQYISIVMQHHRTIHDAVCDT